MWSSSLRVQSSALRPQLSHFAVNWLKPSVHYAVTIPGIYGTMPAFLAEFFMATLLMWCVLWISNRPPIAKYTSYVVGTLIAFYILLFAPVSGFSINPARTTGSAVSLRMYGLPVGFTS